MREPSETGVANSPIMRPKHVRPPHKDHAVGADPAALSCDRPLCCFSPEWDASAAPGRTLSIFHRGHAGENVTGAAHATPLLFQSGVQI